MQGRKYFLNVCKGNFGQKPTPGEVYNSFNEITGHLVAITFKETGHGEAMRLHVVDEHNFYMLSMFVNSRPANAFFMFAKNLVLGQEITFKITVNKEGKDVFSCRQFGGPVLWYYTMENAGQLPLSADGKREYLKAEIIEQIIPALQKLPNPYPNNPFYKPMRKGLEPGYFADVKPLGRTYPASWRERNETGFGKGLN